MSRRELLATITATSLGEPSIESEASEPNAGARVAIEREGQRVTFDAQISHDGQRSTVVPVSIDIARTAVIVCDMQNDFGSKGGIFDRAGIDVSTIQTAVRATAKVLASARLAGIRIVYLKMGFRPDLSDLGALDSVNRVRHLEGFKVGQTMRTPDGRDGRVLVRDTWGTDIVSELSPQADDIVVYKNRSSGFYETELDATLRHLGIKHLVFTGCTTSVCVESTIRDAMFRDFLPILLADCAGEPVGASFSRSNHDASLLVIQTLLGWVSESGEIITALSRV
jgi:ureidoacrylate peracid hydrolase